MQASIFLTQLSPTQQNWTEAYKKDKVTNLIMNHLTTSTNSFPPELISTVHRFFRAHMRENRVQILDFKLVCYVPIGGTDRLVMLLIVPKGLRRLIFDAYHASGIGRHLDINKTLTVLRLRFLWRSIRRNVIAWVRMCAVCIQANNTTYVSKQLVHSWPLLTPFAIISADIWTPGDVISPAGANCLLNCLCDMTQFICSVALAHVNAAKLALAFIEGVLLKFG